MTEQLTLFGEPEEPDLDGYGPYGPLKFPSERPTVILRWSPADEMVVIDWPEFNIKCMVINWPVAFDLALHPNNAHVSVRVRT
jgi:hypothetical protein